MSNLVGIAGLKTAGKDTTFKLLRELAESHGETAIRLAFADKLKVMAALALDFSGSDEELIATMDDFKETGQINHSHSFDSAEGKLELRKGLSGRRYLQLFGAKAREVFGENFWVDQVLNLEAATSGADWICITDCRYPNEAQRVLDLGGEVWEVVRPGLVSDGHSSEQPLPAPLVTLRLYNDGSIEALGSRVADAMRAFGS